VLTDPIAALGTPAGRSAIALLRLSGVGAFEVAGRVLAPFTVAPVRTARRARALSAPDDELLDDVLYLTYAAPRSYTGQDMVEITTHGGQLVPSEVLGALLRAGARLASPGEFTRRAVLNGKLDLLQAEAIGDLVDATAPAQRQVALHQLERGLTARIAALRDQVLELEALTGYDIDFPEEDSGPVAPERVEVAGATLRESLRALLATAGDGMRLREGALAVVAGRPNTGKSSLFNALLAAERAIVTDIPGTTRDAIEAHAVCGGFPFRLVDTAGLRQTDETVEQLGVEVSRRYLAAADIVLFCVEAGRQLAVDERAFLAELACPVVLVRTKGDLIGPVVSEEELVVSARTGSGLERLRRMLAERAFSALTDTGDSATAVTRERHRTALVRALDEVEAFMEARRSGVDPVASATHLRTATGALEDLIGPVWTEDVLERVFATFCVGK
jgi:tRNA modification GTPase